MKHFMTVIIFSLSLVAGNLDSGLKQVKVENYEAAVNSFTKAAICDDFIAQQNLGVLLNSGLGVDYDPEQASYWFGKKDKADKLKARLQRENRKLTQQTFAEKLFPFFNNEPKVQQGFLISQQ